MRITPESAGLPVFKNKVSTRIPSAPQGRDLPKNILRPLTAPALHRVDIATSKTKLPKNGIDKIPEPRMGTPKAGLAFRMRKYRPLTTESLFDRVIDEASNMCAGSVSDISMPADEFKIVDLPLQKSVRVGKSAVVVPRVAYRDVRTKSRVQPRNPWRLLMPDYKNALSYGSTVSGSLRSRKLRASNPSETVGSQSGKNWTEPSVTSFKEQESIPSSKAPSRPASGASPPIYIPSIPPTVPASRVASIVPSQHSSAPSRNASRPTSVLKSSKSRPASAVTFQIIPDAVSEDESTEPGRVLPSRVEIPIQIPVSKGGELIPDNPAFIQRCHEQDLLQNWDKDVTSIGNLILHGLEKSTRQDIIDRREFIMKRKDPIRKFHDLTRLVKWSDKPSLEHVHGIGCDCYKRGHAREIKIKSHDGSNGPPPLHFATKMSKLYIDSNHPVNPIGLPWLTPMDWYKMHDKDRLKMK